MRKIRLCIGSNDGVTIAKSHMGDTECFYIYDLLENSVNTFIEKRTNVAKDMGHAKTSKMKRIIDLVQDADVFIAQKKSPNFVKIAKSTKYQPVVIEADRISEVLMILDESFQDIYSYIERRKNGEIFDTIPVLNNLDNA